METYLEIIKKASEKFLCDLSTLECFFSPGRINLIGEHIDYNGGVVLPCPLDFGTVGVVRKRDDEKVRCYSENFDSDGIIEFVIDEFEPSKDGKWENFLKGMIHEMVDDGYVFNHGFDLYVKGMIPNGAGLSSSASLELLIGAILRDIYYLDYTNLDLVKLGQRCEHNYIGVNCGIMDQFVIGMGKESKAMLINTNTLDYQYVDAALGDYEIVIGNTNYRRTLADSKYNERRSECEEALKLIQSYKDIDNLCQLTSEDLENVKTLLTPTIYKRVCHVVTENERTLAAFAALKNKDIKKLGQLINLSHDSLRDNYEVSGKALDSLVDAFRAEEILGARMTGAGFGGCMIALVHKDLVQAMLPIVAARYQQATNLVPAFYIAHIGSGVHKIEGIYEN